MPDYQKMYYLLFNEITRVIESLQQIQQRTEEIYIDGEETPSNPEPPKTDPAE